MSEDSTEQRPEFAKPEGSEAEMFIQWKGTDVCLDFHCDCGGGGHLDGLFAYFVKCPDCGQIYRMGTQVIATKVEDRPDINALLVGEADERGPEH